MLLFVVPLGRAPIVGPTAAVEQNMMVLPSSLVISPLAGGLVDLSLRASNEIYMFLPSLLVVPLGKAPLVGPTAAVERAHSDRARSGSNGPTGVFFRSLMLGCPHVGGKTGALGISCRSWLGCAHLCCRSRQSTGKSKRPLAGRGGVLLVQTRTNHCVRLPRLLRLGVCRVRV